MNSRYGFNGQEKDDEFYGTSGTSYDFEFRIYNSRLGKFLSVDPLTSEYAWNSPYAFAENRVIQGKDLEGKEFDNACMKLFLMTNDASELPLATLDEGFGDVQTQKFTLSVMGNKQDFAKFEKTFTKTPQEYTNNGWASYSVVHQQNENHLSKDDIIKIDILGPLNNSYVKVSDVQIEKDKFSMTFSTLKGHAEAGTITFSGVIKDNTITITIENTTRINQLQELVVEDFSRYAQTDQWEQVLDNIVRDFGYEKEVSKTKEIKAYEADEKTGSPSGEAKSVKKEELKPTKQKDEASKNQPRR